jgi:hypothetical protein
MSEYLQISKKYFAEETPQNAVKASVEIGGGANGAVVVNYDFVGTEGNDYSIIVSDDNSGDDDVAMTTEYEDGVITILLGTDPDAVGGASIGSGENGTVNIVLDDTTAIEGNTYTVEVVEGADNGNMGAALVGTDITLTLGMTAATIANATIGSGANGEVGIATVEKGDAMNDYTVEVVTNSTEGQNLTSVLTDNALVVTLGNDDGDKASTTIGTGENGSVGIEVDAAGSAGNAFTVAVDATILTQRNLSAALTDTALMVTLATVGDEHAISYIGDGDDGTVYISVDAAGTNGNAFTVEVVAGVGALDVSVTDGVVVVTLAAGGSTASAIETKINTDHAGILTATASGTGLTNLTLAESVKSFTGGTNILSAVANTATLVAGAINDGTAGLTATASGTGGDSLTLSEVVKNFTGGGLNIALDSVKNTALLVAGSITTTYPLVFLATESGNGGTALTIAEAEQSFIGGTDSIPDDAKNTATLVAGAIHAINGVAATASGTGASALDTPETVQFTGDTNTGDISTTKNTATLIANAISALDNFTAVASGNGSGSITVAEVEQAFTGGQYATPAHDSVLMVIGSTWYFTNEGGDRYNESLWYTGSPA